MADNFEDKKAPEGNEGNENNDNNEKNKWWNSVKDFVEGKYKEFTNSLRKDAIDSALDNLQANVEKGLNIDEADNETKKELTDFFNKGKNELETVDTPDEEELVSTLTTNNIFTKDREPEIVAKIVESADKIENEIKNCQREKNLVARSLLTIVNWIMGTEK